MAEEVAAVAEKAPAATEQVVNKVITKVQAGETTSMLQNLWTEHQGTVIHFGKIILLAILVLLVAWIIARI
ncbi:MAG: hypothetical protein IJS08_15470, partial [Victivallales bacterium]|nr:hypothetical protein [Victivallales bacterium]